MHTSPKKLRTFIDGAEQWDLVILVVVRMAQGQRQGVPDVDSAAAEAGRGKYAGNREEQLGSEPEQAISVRGRNILRVGSSGWKQ